MASSPPVFSNSHRSEQLNSSQSGVRSVRFRIYSGSSPWEEYLFHFNAVALVKMLSYSELGVTLFCLLEGYALQVVMGSDNGDNYDFSELCSMF